MAVCVSVDAFNVVSLAPGETNCMYQLLTTAEIQTINGLNGLFSQYFDFNPELFTLVVGGSLLSFASGHVLGRMMGAWRKGM